MRLAFLLAFIIYFSGLTGQNQISGKVVSADTHEPLPFATIITEDNNQTLTKIDGSFQIKINRATKIQVSYVGFTTTDFQLLPGTEYVTIRLQPSAETSPMKLSAENPANQIIDNAITRKPENNPNEVLDDYQHKTYTKFVIDNPHRRLREAITAADQWETLPHTGRAYLSEKVSRFNYIKNQGRKETVLAFKIEGFTKPVFDPLAIEANPFSLYDREYRLFGSVYAGPLANNAHRNYQYKILDTTKSSRPAFVVYFKPKREKVVPGLEGILYLDTTSYAIQRARAQVHGPVKIEVNHNYKYYQEKSLWFPESQTTRMKPGFGGKEISVFGGVVPVGTLQRQNEAVYRLLTGERADPNLLLTSTAYNYDIEFDIEEEIPRPSSEIEVLTDASDKDEAFWEKNRQEAFTPQNKATAQRVTQTIKNKNVERLLEIQKAVENGYFPLGFWNFELGKFVRLNNHEGIRLGIGGKTNDKFSEKFNLGGYGVYGLKDEVFKYGASASIYLNRSTGTNLNFNYSKDIREVGSFEYLTGTNDFFLFQPRMVNINFFYNHSSFSTGLEHRFSSRLRSELRVTHEEVSHLRNYFYQTAGQAYSDYTITEAKFSFLWRPFSKFLKTPTKNILIQKNFPKFTGQINQAFKVLDGNFAFTKFALKAEHEITRLDNSRTIFILEGFYATGDIPLSHVFHAYPNNPTKEKILQRFSVAGRNSFETMYFSEFFSDKQAMLHIKHELRPFNISRNFSPNLAIISRHVIGNLRDKERHTNIDFNTLEHGFSEIGLELNQIIAGLGLSTAYRYGAYHLPDFSKNFSLKFTFHLEL